MIAGPDAETFCVAGTNGGATWWEVSCIPLDSATHEASLARMLALAAEPVALDRTRRAAFIHPDDRGRVDKGFAHALTNRDEYVSEFRAVRTDGAVH